MAGPDGLTAHGAEMQIHLVDATYELFRAHYAPRPPVRGRDGVVLSGVSGLCDQLLYLLREEGATHVGCATDHVIESFRNDLFPGYKSSAGMEQALLDQFPIAEEAIAAMGVVLWPETEFEADDAIGAAAARFAADPEVERILICTPDKDMAQCVVGERVVLRDRRRGITYDRAGVLEKWGVEPASIPDWLALVGDSADGYPGLPGWGAKSAAAVLRRYGSIDEIPTRASDWDVRGVSGAVRLAAVLNEQRADALLYRSLARLRLDTPIPERRAAELEWRGTPRAEWESFCDRWGLERLRARPHRWRDDA
ncbi:MAG TPA: 5'-3' exonuclease H3TH domain-containing protein [Candidatus Limnocylindrales bacterium]